MKPETITITNFTGRLTRVLNGDLNSGFAKFATSWGYDPFSKPGNLTWLNQPSSVGGGIIKDAVLSGQVVSSVIGGGNVQRTDVYAVGHNAYLYQIDPVNSDVANSPLSDVASVLGNITSVAGTFFYGGDLDYYNNKLFITSDSAITSANLDGSSITNVGSVTGGLYHPEVQFLGALYIGNGNNLMKVDTSGILTANILSPALPTGLYINDLDITPDGINMIITASYAYPAKVIGGNPTQNSNPFASASYQFLWNGTDAGITAYQTLPFFPSPTLATFSDKKYYFMNDAFGTALFEGNQKLLTLPNNITPVPNAATGNGTFLTWMSPEMDNPNADVAPSSVYGSLYYFGQLDAQSEVGLFRLLRKPPVTEGDTIPAVPLNMMVNNYSYAFYRPVGWGKHYFSTYEYNLNTSSSVFGFYRFVLPPATGQTPAMGVYETQTQLFSKRVNISQIRVYTEPTGANNGFRLDVIGSDGNIITNGTFNYSYVAGTNDLELQGPMERINFNPAMGEIYSFGLRITNTGTTNMTIRKIEVDWAPQGK